MVQKHGCVWVSGWVYVSETKMEGSGGNRSCFMETEIIKFRCHREAGDEKSIDGSSEQEWRQIFWLHKEMTLRKSY